MDRNLMYLKKIALVVITDNLNINRNVTFVFRVFPRCFQILNALV
jgi:hypothetical protein